jgi:hypothetical protein
VSDKGLPVPPQPMSGQSRQGGYPEGPGGPPGPLGPPPRRKSHRVRHTVVGVLGVLVIVIVILVATSGGGGAPTRASGTGGTSQGRPSARPAPPVRGVGASFTAKDGSGGAYRVRLDLILDPAPAAGRSTTLKHRTRLVGVVFTIKAVSGAVRAGNARRDAVVVASNGHTYTPVTSPIAGYAGFRDGRVKVARHGSATGAVTFQLPAGVTVSTVKWAAGSGSGATLRWPVAQ